MTPRKSLRAALGGLTLIAGTLVWAQLAWAEPKTVLEEVLDLLLEDGRIDEDRYQSLMERHRRERAAAPQPVASPSGAAPHAAPAPGGRASQAAVASAPQTPAAPVAAAAEADDESKRWKFSWRHGFRLERADGAYKLRFGGRIQNEWAAIHTDGSILNRERDAAWVTGTEFRRARFKFSGTVYERLRFKLQIDFAGGDPAFKDAFVGIKGVGPFDDLLIGHFKEPFSLEFMASSNDNVFIQRSLPEVFVPERNTGFGLHTTQLGGRLNWALGVFRDADDFGDGFGNEENYNITTRLTGLPIYEDEGRRLVHVGLSYSHQFRESSPFGYAIDPEIHMADDLVDTGNIENVRHVDLFAPELAFNWGPFSFQSEFKGSLVQRTANQSDLWFWGVYAQASYWLTGEHRPYRTTQASFARVTPLHSFRPLEGQWGAFQAAVRYSYLDLSDQEITGGREDGVTVGMNWHMYRNFRIMLNYNWGRIRGQGNVNALQSRIQIDF